MFSWNHTAWNVTVHAFILTTKSDRIGQSELDSRMSCWSSFSFSTWSGFNCDRIIIPVSENGDYALVLTLINLAEGWQEFGGVQYNKTEKDEKEKILSTAFFFYS